MLTSPRTEHQVRHSQQSRREPSLPTKPKSLTATRLQTPENYPNADQSKQELDQEESEQEDLLLELEEHLPDMRAAVTAKQPLPKRRQ